MDSVFNLRVERTDVTVTVTSNPSVVVEQLQALKSSVIHASKLVVGLGVDCNSADANAKPALLQFCIRTRCLLIQLQHMLSIPPQLKDFLADSKVTFVGLGIQSAVAKLKDGYGLAFANAVELATLPLPDYGPVWRPITGASAQHNLMNLAYNVCRVSISKAPNLPCFYSPSSVLARDEIVNAAKDAYAAYIIGAKLLDACECKSLETGTTVY